MKIFRLHIVFFLLILTDIFLPGQIAAQFNDSVHHMVNISSSGNFNRTHDGMTYLFNNSLKYSLNKKSATLNFSNKWVSFSALVTYNNISRTGRENTLITYGLVAERFF